MPESRREKIAAVVVTYNRQRLLAECLDSLLTQTHPLDGLYIVDNRSTDGTHEYLVGRGLAGPIEGPFDGPRETVCSIELSGFPGRRIEVHSVTMPENTGGAGGFHEGMKRAAEAGFDWLWLMDDDLLTDPDALEVLVRQANALRGRGQESFVLGSLAFARDQADGDTLAFPLQELSASRHPKSGIHEHRRGIYHWRLSDVRDQVKDGLYRWVCPFNGTYVPARAVAEIGLPNKDFFIWGDERDWLWRAAGRYDLYTAVDSRALHPRVCITRFDWKQYYYIRNGIVVNRRFRFTSLRNLRFIVLSLARGARHGRASLILVLRAVRDGLTGRLGRRAGYP
ncbi:MAG TPA: glycosyltransferase [Sedimentisphaerales bacterium]|nr:glycosyltransferase [Sedimentisphaerales bacterium]HNU28558.1 glycosyltransferase [Sedimentisphaerales bacterium]